MSRNGNTRLQIHHFFIIIQCWQFNIWVFGSQYTI